MIKNDQKYMVAQNVHGPISPPPNSIVVKFNSENQIKVAFDFNTLFDLVWCYMNVYISYNLFLCYFLSLVDL